MAEQTYMIFHPTRLAYIRWYIIAVFLITFGVALFIFSSSLPLVLSGSILYVLIFFAVSGIILVAIAEILRKNDKYAITNFRVIEKRGIIKIEEDSIYWEKVANYELVQGLFDRIFKIGTIRLWSTGGEDDPEVVIKRAPQVNKIRFLLDKLIQKK
jgi:uncharacterized membrane protein YdbT with pleckstrin-like domain